MLLTISLVESIDAVECKVFDVLAWIGNTVTFEIENVWGEKPSASLPLYGELDADLKCQILVTGAEIATWFNREPPLNAAVNENLLDFRIAIAGTKDGVPWLEGQSDNLLYVYRRKTIVFLPGLFASKFLVKVDGREVLAYPNFSVDPSQLPLEISLDPLLGPIATVAGVVDQLRNQEIGILECDDQGIPFAKAEKKPKLLRLGPLVKVADVYVQCHEARLRRLRRAPRDPLFYELQVVAYDWRTDLTNRAHSILDTLQDIQKELRLFADTDDQVAIVGHSTGGVIMRRMMCEPRSHDLISHAFFIDVPFRGAPKALSMILTGRAWPGGDYGVDFLKPESIVDVALSQPVVYHLAPSLKYPESVVSLPEDTPGTKRNRAEEKRELIKTAARCGIYRERRVAKASRIVNRSRLALSADRWHGFCTAQQRWDDVAEVYRGYLSKEEFEARDEEERRKARDSAKLSQAEITLNSLVRTTGGWNEALAQQAQEFHDVSETCVDRSWAKKIFLFYAKGRTTTSRIRIDKIEMSELRGCKQTIDADDFKGRHKSSKYSGSNRDREGLECKQFIGLGRDVLINHWAFTADFGDGDETVPICSQLGFGMQVEVFKPIKIKVDDEPGKAGPKHMDAPNSPWVWDRIIEVLQGVNVEKYLDDEVCTVTGEEGTRMPVCQE